MSIRYVRIHTDEDADFETLFAFQIKTDEIIYDTLIPFGLSTIYLNTTEPFHFEVITDLEYTIQPISSTEYSIIVTPQLKLVELG